MSDMPPGAVSLEEPLPQTPPATPQAEPVAPPPPPANPEDADPEGTVVADGGGKFVPLSALAAARQSARDAKAEAALLKGKADKLDQIHGEWQAAQPILERARQMVTQPSPPKPAGPLSDQEAIELARDLDLFDDKGAPDVGRAQRIASRQEAIAQRQAQQFVAPLAHQTAATQSRALLDQVAAFKDAKGHQIDRGTLERVWANVPIELSSQPNVAAILYRVALAEQVLAGNYRGIAQAPPPVVDTAALGGGQNAPLSLTAMDHAFRTAADMSEKDFTSTRDKFQPGRTNSLE